MQLKRFLLYSAVSAAAGFGISASAYAQDQVTEVIEVVGIRGSLDRALDIKRDATGVVDAISAEDIGKFPDANVAESIGRIPGVAVSRQFGEGDAISIRGASNALTLTTLNGQNVSSSGWYSQQAIDRTFNYQMLPPEMISGIEVYKSSQANLVEGGVGGTVNVKTRKPLDLDPNAIFASLKVAADSTATDEKDPALSGLYSFKNDAETFGVLISAAMSEYTLERRGNEGLPSWGGRIAPVHFQQDRERTAYDIAAQVAPNDALSLNLHYMNLELVADSVNTAIWIPSDLANCDFNYQGTAIFCENNNGAAGDSFWDVRPRNATMESEVVDFTIEYEGSGFTASAQVGTTDSSGGTDFETNFGYLFGIGGADGIVDATGDVVDFQLDDPTFNLPAAGTYAAWEGLQQGAVVNQPRTDEETYFQADVTFDVELGAINSLQAGVRQTDHDIEQSQNRPTFNAYNLTSTDPDSLTSGTVTAGMDGFTLPAPDGSAMIGYTLDRIDEWHSVRSGFGTISEDNTAAYLMANFEVDGLKGNLGFRYVSTDASTTFYAPDPTVIGETLANNNGYSRDISEEETSYSEVLPSLNLAFDASDDVIIRFSAAQVIARPNYNDMFGNSALVGYNDTVPGNESVRQGNVGLEPYKAFQSDLAWEWYYGESNLLSIAYFIKDISSFTTFSSTPGVSIGIVDPDSGVDSWTIQSLTNGEGGEVKGFEFQLQHDFGNGFGGLFNATLANSSAEAINYPDRNTQFSDSSDETFNVVGYFENDLFSARAALTSRSEYFIRETGFYGAREHQDYTTLDLSFGYNLTDSIGLTAEVTNVTEEDSVQVGRDLTNPPVSDRTTFDYPAYAYEGERRVIFGVNGRF
jgi:iron complex outermembrane receptor protein